MKKTLASILMSVALIAVAVPAGASGFLSFGQNISIGPTSTLTVQETIAVDFSAPRHGIFRDLPVKYVSASGNPFSLRVRVISVTDDNGQSIDFSSAPNGDFLRVQIGSADRLVSGRQTYILTYAVSRALLYLDDHDELYWNVVTEAWGDLGWPQEVSASVVLPGQIAAADIRTRCFTGLGVGAPEDCQKSAASGVAQFSVTDKPLTIVVGWPKGLTVKPAPIQQIQDWLADNWIVFWPIAVFVLMFLLWYRKGRDPKVQQAIVVQYESPGRVNPAELGVLVKQTAGLPELTSTIVHLAVKGFLNISEDAESGVFGRTLSYSFELKNPDWSGLTDYESGILAGIFGAGAAAGTIVAVSELKEKFYTTAAVVKKQMADAAVVRGWFSKSPMQVRAIYLSAAVIYGMAVSFLAHSLVSGPAGAISMYLPCLIILGFGWFMPARTAEGTNAYALALGFKEYLSKAEKYRLQWQEKENIFELFLPYAMVFGVVDKWAQAFEGLQLQPPSWYHGSTFAAWSPLMFANSLNSAASSFGQTMMTAPSAKGGGGFGSGGGGGGGFGGGGGGSW